MTHPEDIYNVLNPIAVQCDECGQILNPDEEENGNTCMECDNV